MSTRFNIRNYKTGLQIVLRIFFQYIMCALNKINKTIPLGVKIISLLKLTSGFDLVFLIISIELLFSKENCN